MKVLIICAGDSNNENSLIDYANNSDYVICADGGYNYACDSGIKPDILIGDFDSVSDVPDEIEKIKLKCEKDETDTLYALRYAIKKGAKDVVVYGGLGSRFDHSFANLCVLFEALEKGVSAILTDGKTVVYATDDKLELKGRRGDYISVFSFCDISYNVSIKGLKYSLSHYDLKNTDIIGVSNEFTEDTAEISVEKGKLIIICN